MAGFVLDCSATIACFLSDEPVDVHPRIQQALVEGPALAPAIWTLEVLNVLMVAERRNRVRSEELPRILADLNDWSVLQEAPPVQGRLQEILALARRTQLSSYDAAYLEIAQRNSISLATLDRRLAKAAEAIGVKLLLQES